MTDEQEINAAWFGVEYVRSGIGAEHDFVRFLDEDGEVAAHVTGHAKEAAEFTRTRQEEIRQVEREIDVLNEISERCKTSGEWYGIEIARILAREQQALDALKKGMIDGAR